MTFCMDTLCSACCLKIRNLKMAANNDLIEQFAINVEDFSSQYGSETSISYTVSNLIGECNIYPKYGDFTQACVFRTYGKWWKTCRNPCSQVGQSQIFFKSDDFVDLSYNTAVYPKKIDIIETYNPGAIVRILACSVSPDPITKRFMWKTLWKGHPLRAKASPRIFSPEINEIKFKTRLIRLEINSSLLDYYTELDAVRLTGTLDSEKQGHDDSAMCDIIQNFLHIDMAENNNGKNYFEYLPEEVIQKIIRFLDLMSKCTLAATCRKLRDHCYDPHQYKCIDLQPFWPTVDDETLQSLAKRCNHLEKLSLNWCGRASGMPSLGSFLNVCGTKLNVLKFGNCKFLEENGLKTVVDLCPNLQELCLQSTQSIPAEGFWVLSKLQYLKKLDLYRTMIDTISLVMVIRGCQDIEDLNLGSCCNVKHFDQVAQELGKFTKKLKSVDFWRAHSLSDTGLIAIAENCSLLEEIDLGWCSEVHSSQESIQYLAKHCPNLRKIFLTANRRVHDNDLIALSNYSTHLKQVDVLGTREITPKGVRKILMNCKDMEFFDLSFCANIDRVLVDTWREEFPHVEFKQSFQN